MELDYMIKRTLIKSLSLIMVCITLSTLMMICGKTTTQSMKQATQAPKEEGNCLVETFKGIVYSSVLN